MQRFGAKKLSCGFLAASGNLMSGFLVVVFSCSFCMFASFGAAVFAADVAAAAISSVPCSCGCWLLRVGFLCCSSQFWQLQRVDSSRPSKPAAARKPKTMKTKARKTGAEKFKKKLNKITKLAVLWILLSF